MSRRYGRNQKRAHRTRIAELEAQVAKLQKDYDGMWRAARELREEIDCAKRIVGEYCVAFNPRTQTMSFKQADFVTIMSHERDHNSGVTHYWDFNRDPFAQPWRVEQIRLPIMCALAGEEIRGARHVFVAYDGKRYGYAISPGAWDMARYPEELCRQIANRMMPHIYEELSKPSAASLCPTP